MAGQTRQPRIALVTYAMYCGGMEAFLLRLGRYLKQHGCDIEVITTVEPGEWFGRWAELHIKAEHVTGHESSGLLRPLFHSQRVLSRLRAGNYDVVFLNHARHAQASLSRLPENVIVIPVLHNDAPEIYKVGCGNPDAWNVAVAVSPKVASVARRRLPGRPVLEVTSGVDLPDASLWQRRQSLNRHMELIFIGRIEHSQKGVLSLPDIYRACLDRGIDASLTVVGDGPDSDRLHQRLSELDLHQKTRHLKGLIPERVYELLIGAHVLLMPSRYEGLPIALLESQACGCVPVASRLQGITDAAVEDGRTGMLVDVGDVGAFADAVAALWSDPAQWSRMSHAAHEGARLRFSVEAMGASYLRLVTQALDGHYPLVRPRKYQPPLDLGVFSWKDFLPTRLRRLGRRGRTWLASFSGARRATAIR
jgi:glycosyltransferase involved in cell wall biosynthesis